jgi:hypothetical protein
MGLSEDRACRIVVRTIKGRKTGRNLERQWCAGLSMLLGRGEKATNSWKSPIPEVMIPGSHWLRRFNCLRYSQNVAGLWLKYGAKSQKTETFQRCKILFDDATIC